MPESDTITEVRFVPQAIEQKWGCNKFPAATPVPLKLPKRFKLACAVTVLETLAAFVIETGLRVEHIKSNISKLSWPNAFDPHAIKAFFQEFGGSPDALLDLSFLAGRVPDLFELEGFEVPFWNIDCNRESLIAEGAISKRYGMH